MSASICYRQIKPIEGKDLPVWAPSYFIGTLEKAFGNFPCVLDADDIATLRGMAATCQDGAVEIHGNPYEELIKAIQKLGTVEVYAEY